MDYEAMLNEARLRNAADRQQKDHLRMELEKKLEAAKVKVERQFGDLAKFVEKKLGSTLVLRACQKNHDIDCVYRTFDCDSGHLAPDGFELAFGIVNNKLNLFYMGGHAPGHVDGEKLDRTLRDKCGLAQTLIFDIIEPIEKRLSDLRGPASPEPPVSWL